MKIIFSEKNCKKHGDGPYNIIKEPLSGHAVLGEVSKCDVCGGRKILTVYDEYDGKFKGSRKCWKCNDGNKYYDPFWNY